MKLDEPIWIPGRLQDFAAGKKPEPAPVWQPPTLEDFAWGIRVQSFDQTLTSTGYLQFEVGEWTDGIGVKIWDLRTIRPKPSPELKSFPEKFERAYQLGSELIQIVMCTDDVVCEMPAVTGWETESSLLAGSEVYTATMENQGRPPTLVSKKHAGAVLCNDPGAKKPVIREAISRYVETKGKGWNEHTRDALANGLTHLYDLKRKPRD